MAPTLEQRFRKHMLRLLQEVPRESPRPSDLVTVRLPPGSLIQYPDGHIVEVRGDQ